MKQYYIKVNRLEKKLQLQVIEEDTEERVLLIKDITRVPFDEQIVNAIQDACIVNHEIRIYERDDLGHTSNRAKLSKMLSDELSFWRDS